MFGYQIFPFIFIAYYNTIFPQLTLYSKDIITHNKFSIMLIVNSFKYFKKKKSCLLNGKDNG